MSSRAHRALVEGSAFNKRAMCWTGSRTLRQRGSGHSLCSRALRRRTWCAATAPASASWPARRAPEVHPGPVRSEAELATRDAPPGSDLPGDGL